MFYWRTKDQQIIPIPELTDRHLFNIWNMIKGKIYIQRTASQRCQAESMLRGDMALHSVEEYFNEDGESLDNEDFYYKHTNYDHILKEIRCRELFDEKDEKIIKIIDEKLRELNDETYNY